MIRKPLKVRILTALALGELTQRQLARMLDAKLRTIEQELCTARRNGYVRTARFEIIRLRKNPKHIAHYELTPQGIHYARGIIHAHR